MSRDPDGMAAVYDVMLIDAAEDKPWQHSANLPPMYLPNFDLLGDLLSSAIRLGAGDDTESGISPKAYTCGVTRAAPFRL